jgi:hypothetical protein
LINNEGYLIDQSENIIDIYGRIVFPKEWLSETRGMDAMIPKVFRMKNLLTKPYNPFEMNPEDKPNNQSGLD